jgi:hypothetical protein
MSMAATVGRGVERVDRVDERVDRGAEGIEGIEGRSPNQGRAWPGSVEVPWRSAALAIRPLACSWAVTPGSTGATNAAGNTAGSQRSATRPSQRLERATQFREHEPAAKRPLRNIQRWPRRGVDERVAAEL